MPCRGLRPAGPGQSFLFSSAATIAPDHGALGTGGSFVGDDGDSPGAAWTGMYGLLVEYHREHNSTIVPDHCDNAADLEIGEWVKAQRNQSRSLSPVQKIRLNEIGFVWDHQEARWLEKYERLCDYESKMPDAMKSTTDVSLVSSSDLESVFEKRYNEDPVLRRWVNAQRQKYRQETISMERVKLLDKVEGFVWDVKEARWFEMHRRLSLFARKHNGSCIVPQHYRADPQLASWVSNQRQRKHQLTSERIQLLDALGFVWDVREIQWLGNYESYKSFYFGSPREESATDGDSAVLAAAGGSSGNRKDGDHGDLDVSTEEQRLIDWAIKQRRSYRNGTLSPYRIKMLGELEHPVDGSGFRWDPQGENWMESYHALKDYRSRHNHVMVPTRGTRCESDGDHGNYGADDSDSNAHFDAAAASPSSSDRQLGVWVANQRRNYKKGTLSAKRQRLLEDIDFVWDAPKAQWDDHFRRLVEYQRQRIADGKERSTSTLVPQHYKSDPQLAIWVKEQRQNLKNGILTPGRKQLLDEIGFVWDATPSSPLP
eukprot:CAMPEP_0201134422 /NCGR_PEP_ID=MMETSP0850-20130426/51582_1 /ASSEMBLY_ACC=CAM_ASM_000622 /TAXON_ID=183588 /ORGANISM="Pseudo-nitzschia fraudulenta, Strain WWA7" /LENGTH=541 /DNA_ID=CAMNT_0047405301 /DNA_START=49 /DNA_END=1677 /DNA_ORIENTATION=-